MTMYEMEVKLKEVFGFDMDVEFDNDGQIVIYTDLMIKPGDWANPSRTQELVPFEQKED